MKPLPPDSVQKVLPALPVEAITRVAEMRNKPYHYAACFSRPGHLIHLITHGNYILTTNGRRYHVKQGDVIYYHDCEDVTCQGTASKVVFITIGFFAPELLPPALSQRCCQANGAAVDGFHQALSASRRQNLLQRTIGVYHGLLKIIENMPWDLTPRQEEQTSESALWWEIERGIRASRDYCITVKEVAWQCQRSIRTVTRSCQHATNMPPGRRIRMLRLDAARGLLGYTEQSITEIAKQLGYARLQEFSREFANVTGVSPSQFRKRIQL
jgi:AraC-like DNA-binding protein